MVVPVKPPPQMQARSSGLQPGTEAAAVCVQPEIQGSTFAGLGEGQCRARMERRIADHCGPRGATRWDSLDGAGGQAVATGLGGDSGSSEESEDGGELHGDGVWDRRCWEGRKKHGGLLIYISGTQPNRQARFDAGRASLLLVVPRSRSLISDTVGVEPIGPFDHGAATAHAAPLVARSPSSRTG